MIDIQVGWLLVLLLGAVLILGYSGIRLSAKRIRAARRKEGFYDTLPRHTDET